MAVDEERRGVRLQEPEERLRLLLRRRQSRNGPDRAAAHPADAERQAARRVHDPTQERGTPKDSHQGRSARRHRKRGSAHFRGQKLHPCTRSGSKQQGFARTRRSGVPCLRGSALTSNGYGESTPRTPAVADLCAPGVVGIDSVFRGPGECRAAVLHQRAQHLDQSAPLGRRVARRDAALGR